MFLSFRAPREESISDKYFYFTKNPIFFSVFKIDKVFYNLYLFDCQSSIL